MSLFSYSNRISYGGYTFNNSSQTDVQIEYVHDEAGRTVIYQKLTLVVKSVVASDSGTGDSLDYIKGQLTKQGAALHFTDQGFGSLKVNAGGVKDVMWGPKPTMLSWEPIGSLQACEVVWQCEVHLSPCSRYTGIMSLNYGVDFSFQAGITKRTIRGHLLIAQTRNGTSIPDSADAYREKINPDLPLGYKRSIPNFTLSLDKSRLDFTFVDEQINSENPYPPGIVEIDAKHKSEWRRGSPHQPNTISSTIETAVDFPRSLAYEVFLTIARVRIEEARRQYKGILLDRFSAEEELFTRESSFSISYRILRSLDEIAVASGWWKPLGTDWRDWRVSMKVSHSNRGHSGLTSPAGDDAIVDLCAGSGGGSSSSLDNVPIAIPPGLQPTLKNEKPPAKNSWLSYQSDIRIVQERPVVQQSILQEPDTIESLSDLNSTSPPSYSSNSSSSGYDDIVQETGVSSYWAIYTGSAERAGHRVPRPVLDSVGGQSAKMIYSQFDQRPSGAELGVTVFQARWCDVYVLGGAPGVVELPKNPLDRTDGNGKIGN